MAEQKCLCGSRAFSLGEGLFFILDDLKEGKITSAEDIEYLGAGIRGLSYCGIDTSKIEKQFDVLKRSLEKVREAKTSHEAHRFGMDALLDHDNLERAIGDALEKCSKGASKNSTL